MSSYSFIHSFVHSWIHSFVNSFFNLSIHSFIPFNWFLQFIHLFIHSFIRLLIHSFLHSFILSLIRSLTYSFINSLIQSLNYPFIPSSTFCSFRAWIPPPELRLYSGLPWLAPSFSLSNASLDCFALLCFALLALLCFACFCSPISAICLCFWSNVIHKAKNNGMLESINVRRNNEWLI